MRLFIIFICLCLFTGCYTVDHHYRGVKEITPGTKLSQPSVSIGNVQGSKKRFYLLAGIIPLNDASGAELVDDLATQNYAGHDGVTRVKIAEKMDVVDCIVNALIGGIFGMMTVEVSGEVHQYSK